MTQDTELFEKTAEQESSAPPLCLVHYFGATGQGPPSPSIGRIAERDGNLLILEFAPPPKTVTARRGKSLMTKVFDSLLLLLLLVSAIACIAAFRF